MMFAGETAFSALGFVLVNLCRLLLRASTGRALNTDSSPSAIRQQAAPIHAGSFSLAPKSFFFLFFFSKNSLNHRHSGGKGFGALGEGLKIF